MALAHLRSSIALLVGVLVCASCSEGSSTPDDEDCSRGGCGATSGMGGAGGTTAGLGGAGSATAGDGGAGGTTPGDGGAGGAGGTTAGDGGTGGSAGASPARTCKTPCSTTADCEAITLAPGANDYVCTNGGCEAAGCMSDVACESYLPGYVCRSVGTAVPTCTPSCNVAADCSLGSLVYDADNYGCVDGGCVYLGCNTDMECQGTDATRACGDSGASVKTCADRCTTTEECGIGEPWSDPDNFECRAGLCYYRGCNDDTECEGIDQVCR